MSEEVDLSEVDEYGMPIDKNPDRQKRFERIYGRIFGGARFGLTQMSFENLDSHYRQLDVEQRTEVMLDVSERQAADLLYLYNLRIDVLLAEALTAVDNLLGADITGLLPGEEVMTTFMKEQRRLQDRILTIQERRQRLLEKRLLVEGRITRTGTPKEKKPASGAAQKEQANPGTATTAVSGAANPGQHSATSTPGLGQQGPGTTPGSAGRSVVPPQGPATPPGFAMPASKGAVAAAKQPQTSIGPQPVHPAAPTTASGPPFPRMLTRYS